MVGVHQTHTFGNDPVTVKVGIIAKGELLLIEEKAKLMARMGKKELEVQLTEPLDTIPKSLAKYELAQTNDKTSVIYTYDTRGERTGITQLLNDIAAAGLSLSDVSTRQSSLEDIFVTLVQEDAV